MIQAAVFYSISGILILSALMVVTKRNLFTCALYLACVLSMVAGLFILLGADFLAAVQILLYVGGILVIIAFAVMLSSAYQVRSHPQVNAQWFPSLLVCLAILMFILAGLRRNPFSAVLKEGICLPTTYSMGQLLLKDMKLPFEVVSLVLMVSLIGAVLFTKKSEKRTEEK